MSDLIKDVPLHTSNYPVDDVPGNNSGKVPGGKPVQVFSDPADQAQYDKLTSLNNAAGKLKRATVSQMPEKTFDEDAALGKISRALTRIGGALLTFIGVSAAVVAGVATGGVGLLVGGLLATTAGLGLLAGSSALAPGHADDVAGAEASSYVAVNYGKLGTKEEKQNVVAALKTLSPRRKPMISGNSHFRTITDCIALSSKTNKPTVVNSPKKNINPALIGLVQDTLNLNGIHKMELNQKNALLVRNMINQYVLNHSTPRDQALADEDYLQSLVQHINSVIERQEGDNLEGSDMHTCMCILRAAISQEAFEAIPRQENMVANGALPV